MRTVVINHEAREFYCWRWCRWQSYRKYAYCCQTGCRRMETPPDLAWKARYLGGLSVLCALA